MPLANDKNALRGVQRACASGLDSVTLRRELARRIAPVIAYDAYAFSTCDPDTGLMSHTVAQGIPRALGRTYVEHLYPTEYVAITSMQRRGTAVLSTFDASSETRDTFRGYGLDAEVHLILGVEDRLWGTWCMMRTRQAPRDANRSLAFLRRAAPYVARGLKAATVVDQARALAEAPMSLEGPGVIVLDHRDRPIIRTPLVNRWLRDLADEGFDGDGDIPLCMLGLSQRVRRTRCDLPHDVALRVRGTSGRWYSLRASLAEYDTYATEAVVIVVRPLLRREIAPSLRTLYGLSDREREVVAAVARGEPTKCIAATLHVSPHTVDEHLERACRKIGVRGRKALVARLFVDGYAPALDAPAPGALSVSRASPATQ